MDAGMQGNTFLILYISCAHGAHVLCEPCGHLSTEPGFSFRLAASGGMWVMLISDHEAHDHEAQALA